METLVHLKALRQGVISTRTVNNFLAENGPKPATIYKSGSSEKLYDTTIDWDTLRAVKGIVFGLYLEMRNDGAKAIANEVLLQEGMPQNITEYQRKRLEFYDEVIK